eukprot:1892429-Alexandrium_andersonii.AAC.2
MNARGGMASCQATLAWAACVGCSPARRSPRWTGWQARCVGNPATLFEQPMPGVRLGDGRLAAGCLWRCTAFANKQLPAGACCGAPRRASARWQARCVGSPALTA